MRPWFRRWGWIYRPIALPGWIVIALASLFSVNVFLAVDRHSHSVSDTLYAVFPYLVSVFVIVGWIAVHTSESS